MTITPHRRRAAWVLTALGGAMTLAACGSEGVMPNGALAAQYGPTKVSVSDVQDAVADIRTLQGQGEPYSTTRAAVVLALAPEISRIASRAGAVESASAIEQSFQRAGVSDPSPAAVQLYKAEREFDTLRNGTAAGQSGVQRLLSTADVKLNPRYGSYRRGGAFGPATTNWIKPSATPAPAQ